MKSPVSVFYAEITYFRKKKIKSLKSLNQKKKKLRDLFHSELKVTFLPNKIFLSENNPIQNTSKSQTNKI